MRIGDWSSDVYSSDLNNYEKDIEQYVGESVHVAALSAGTAALHLALILLDVKRDDIVLCQSMTFSASANPIAYLGATPVFIDSEEDTWNMDPQALEEAIKVYEKRGTKHKAIIPVHLYRSEARRVGKEDVRTCRSGGAP